MGWTETDLKKLKDKGFSVDDSVSSKKETTEKLVSSKKEHANKKIEKVSVEKNTIGFVLMSLKQKGLITDFVTEHKFDSVRKFRFDWAIIDLKIAIEFEGIMSAKSRHTTVTGYTNDCKKYNFAQKKGWKVMRYTALNYLDLEADMKELICIFEEQNRTLRQQNAVSNNHNKSNLL